MQSKWRHALFLGGAILAFTIAVSVVGFWKYGHYRYQGFDLAIYTNVLSSLANSHGWHSSIQGSSYLGDHIEPILLAIVPFFRLWPDARLLIILQALALGLTAIPIHLLLRNVGTRERWSIVLSALWLLNPLLWNAALFEFHALALAPLFLLSAAYAYIRRRLGWFLFWILLALSVREDVALIVVMLGAISAYDWFSERVTRRGGPPARAATEHAGGPQRQDPRAAWWIGVPVLLGIVWFLFTTRIAAAHSANGAYKFLIYYGWLAPRSLGEVGLRAVWEYAAPFLQHLASIGNLDMALGLLLPFLFLPIFRPRWLLLAVPPLLQILLAAPGGSNIVVETHYALLFLPALVLAAADVIAPWQRVRDRSNQPTAVVDFDRRSEPLMNRWLVKRFPLPRPFAIGLGIAAYLAVAWVLGPFPGITRIITRGASVEDRARRVAYDELLARVPQGASIAAGYAALPYVAVRRGAYALPYAYLGVNQYAFAPYSLPDDVRYLLLDQRDALTYAVQFPSVRWSVPYAASGPENLQQLVDAGHFRIIGERNGVALLERDAQGSLLSDRYIRATAPPDARLIVDGLRDVTVSAP